MLSWSWVIFSPVIEVSDSFFFSSSSDYGLSLVMQTYLNNFDHHVLIYLFWSSCFFVLVLPYFYHLNWLMVNIIYHYLVLLCVMFQFLKQTQIYPMKVLYSVPCLYLYPCLMAFQNMIMILFVSMFASYQYCPGFYLLLDSSMEY